MASTTTSRDKVATICGNTDSHVRFQREATRPVFVLRVCALYIYFSVFTVRFAIFANGSSCVWQPQTAGQTPETGEGSLVAKRRTQPVAVMRPCTEIPALLPHCRWR
eukprot:SAG31_NODE_8461_length_1446_cov_2.392725_2_plen_107_part_00